MVSVPEHTMEEIPLQEEEEVTMEYRVLMVYAQRSLSESKYLNLQRAISSQGGQTAIGNGKEEKANGETKTPKSKPKKKRWPKTLTPACLRPPKKTMNDPLEKAKDPEEERARSIVSQLQRIVQKITKQEKQSGFRMMKRVSSIQHDGDDEDEIIANIVQILRATGDRLNDEITEERTLLEKIKGLWSYNFYKKVTDCFLSEVVPTSDADEEEQTSKIAMCLHATTALTTLENQPMNKILGFGTRYLKDNYSPWIQSRGGWEKAMGIQTGSEEEIE
ncbi:apoptosis facilitator Bcl-2-like protein 14 [Rana temporaria]|uniref:apoptosis facilitator Bcl-2-like protein 14 n=1 Tax=Rana temporaria TaxID=8407 RepID=UPI001AACB6BF|nr:apoptosis facilitator Bcl-2-like protein 14 [Rana temporaria]XP_040201314.1 apoptosis facilitator Bcl-2-like protein 14 [Rana temporaria]